MKRLLLAGLLAISIGNGTLIDMIRIFLIERPVFDHFDKIEEMILKVWKQIKRALKAVYGIILRWTA